MCPSRADIEIELRQLEQRFGHLADIEGSAVDYSSFVRGSERVLALIPASDRGDARDRIDALLAQLRDRIRRTD
jgi:hypothetical protein